MKVALSLFFCLMALGWFVACDTEPDDLYQATLTGKLYFENPATRLEELASGATVSLEDNSGFIQKTKTDATGEFRFQTLTAGDYTLKATFRQAYAVSNAGLPYSAKRTVTIAHKTQAASEQKILLTPDAPGETLLRIEPADSAGFKLDNCLVTLYSDAASARADTGFTNGLRQATTNGQGIALFVGLEEKAYRVKARYEKGVRKLRSAPDGHATNTLSKGTIVNTLITLTSFNPALPAPEPILRVVTVDSLGFRLAGSRVLLYRDATSASDDLYFANGLREAITDANGVVSFQGLELGKRYFLKARFEKELRVLRSVAAGVPSEALQPGVLTTTVVLRSAPQ